MEPYNGFPQWEKELIPSWDSIPEEFKNPNRKNKWVDDFETMFFWNHKIECKPKEGVDKEQALEHIRKALTSYAYRHEHKEAGVAFLLSQYFDEFSVTKYP